jgi:hypothetical protein
MMCRTSWAGIILLLWAVATGVAGVTEAVDLDAPSKKKVTVGSEIERGKEAIAKVVSSIGVTKPLAYRMAISSIFDREKQKNTDTESFLLGASFEAWSKLDHLLTIAAKNPNPLFFSMNDIDNIERWTAIYFKDFRKLQKKLGLSDEKVAEALGIKLEMIKGALYRWDKKMGI